MREIFGKAMKSARIFKKMTLRELSENVGKSISFLSDIESGRKKCPDPLMSKIQNCLNMRSHFMDICANCNVYVPDDSGLYMCFAKNYTELRAIRAHTAPSEIALNIILCDKCVDIAKQKCIYDTDAAENLSKLGVGICVLTPRDKYFFTLDQLFYIVPVAAMRLAKIIYISREDDDNEL